MSRDAGNKRRGTEICVVLQRKYPITLEHTFLECDPKEQSVAWYWTHEVIHCLVFGHHEVIHCLVSGHHEVIHCLDFGHHEVIHCLDFGHHEVIHCLVSEHHEVIHCLDFGHMK
jgi:hypothetical protein